jgi:hypothetical protein
MSRPIRADPVRAKLLDDEASFGIMAAEFFTPANSHTDKPQRGNGPHIRRIKCGEYMCPCGEYQA